MATNQMNRTERWLYRDLLELYFILGHALPGQLESVLHLYHLHISAETLSTGEQEILIKILVQQFEATSQGYRHSACEQQISRAAMRAQVAQKNGRRGGRPPKHNPCNSQTNVQKGSTSAQRTALQHSPQEAMLPSWLPKKQWQAFLAMRAERKKPLTNAGIRLALSKLAALRDAGHAPSAVLEQSTLYNWLGLFALKTNSPSQRDMFDFRQAQQASTDAGRIRLFGHTQNIETHAG